MESWRSKGDISTAAELPGAWEGDGYFEFEGREFEGREFEGEELSGEAIALGWVGARCFSARSLRAYSPRLMEVSAILPRVEGVGATGETIKSKCRVASSEVFAGGALLTAASGGVVGTSPLGAPALGTSITGGTVMVEGSVAEPR